MIFGTTLNSFISLYIYIRSKSLSRTTPSSVVIVLLGLNEFLYFEILVNLRSHVRRIQYLKLKIITKKGQHGVRLIACVIIDRDAIRKLKEETLDCVVHDHDVLQ
jgi:uncharacterized protein with PQ loop repeat